MPIDLSVGLADDSSPSDRMLARIGFGHTHEVGPDPRIVQIGLPPLGDTHLIERWQSAYPVETGRHGEIAYASDGRILFGHVLLEETAERNLETVSHHAYRTILACLDAFSGLHLVRVWNYLHAINQEQAGLERYRSFCIGRSRAFAEGEIVDRSFPAACALGSNAPGLMISFLAACQPGRQIENPRQVSAFRYPPRYGPKSPSFSRALLCRLTADRNLLFISGTASIVGHETQHQGDKEAQLEETCRNLRAVLDAAGPGHELEAIRLYIRYPMNAPALIASCQARLGNRTRIISLESAICRQDLLLEIEGVAVANGAGAVSD